MSASIDEKFLTKLRDAGLHVSEPIPAFRNGVWVCKPIATPGHNIPGYEGGYITIGDGAGCPDIDAPMLKFMHLEDKWQVHGQDSAGGMGSADFMNEWSTADEAERTYWISILEILQGWQRKQPRKRRSALEQSHPNRIDTVYGA